MRRMIGALLFVVALVAAAVGGSWAFMKAAGAEVDYCAASDCTSGWYPASALLALAAVAGLASIRLLRRERGGS